MTEHTFDRRLLLGLAALSPAVAAGLAGSLAEAQTPAPLVVIAEITAKPDQADALRALLLPFAAAVRGEPGCLHYTVLEDQQTAGHFFTYESWADKAALAAHMQAPAIMALGPKAVGMIAKPPSQAVLSVLSAA